MEIMIMLVMFLMLVLFHHQYGNLRETFYNGEGFSNDIHPEAHKAI
jgi:hypothetical protein